MAISSLLSSTQPLTNLSFITPSFLKSSSPKLVSNNDIAQIEKSSLKSCLKSRRHPYKMSLRQQPLRARICGSADSEKRTIDPPPIIELLRLDEDNHEHKITKDIPNLYMRAELWSADSKYQVFTSARVPVGSPLIIGGLKQRGQVLHDERNSFGCLFSFPSISIRCSGEYRLRFSIHQDKKVVGDGEESSESESEEMGESLLTTPFQVYTPRDFPGMTGSSDLTKCLRNQGVRFVIRKAKSLMPVIL